MITARIARRALGAATLVVGLLGSTMALPVSAGVTITGAGSAAESAYATEIARPQISSYSGKVWFDGPRRKKRNLSTPN